MGGSLSGGKRGYEGEGEGKMVGWEAGINIRDKGAKNCMMGR